MGWKAACVLINEREPGYLGTMPQHDPARASALIHRLGLGRFQSRGLTTFDEGIYPRKLMVGAYEGGAVIGDLKIGDDCLEAGADPLTLRLFECYPRAAVLRVGLHSVVNLWSYAYFEEGRLIRAYGGSADDGVVLDSGELLPEERPHFERSVIRDGVRYFETEINGQMEEFDASAYGEELVFEVMARFFGCRPDRPEASCDPFELAMEVFEPHPIRRWWWPFGKG